MSRMRVTVDGNTVDFSVFAYHGGIELEDACFVKPDGTLDVETDVPNTLIDKIYHDFSTEIETHLSENYSGTGY